MGIYAGGWQTVGAAGFIDGLDAAARVLSAAVDLQNCKRGDVLLQVTFASAPDATGTVKLYALAGNDNAVYATGSASAAPQESALLVELDLAGTGTTQVLQAIDVALPVSDAVKLLVENNTSVEITSAVLQVLPHIKAV